MTINKFGTDKLSDKVTPNITFSAQHRHHFTSNQSLFSWESVHCDHPRAMAREGFRPALLVVDMQEDFCPPSGTLAVPNARTILPLINHLLSLPTFTLRIATKDWHPPTHISFAPNHSPTTRPFLDTTTITNPLNPQETYTTHLWPIHCLQDTPGASLVPELNTSKLDHIIHKGQNPQVEMYSAFYSPLRNPTISDSGLAKILHSAEITHVYVVGLAADYCVRCTAEDAKMEGFKTYIIEEGTKAVDPEGWEKCKAEIEGKGVKVVSIGGEEVKRLF
ncbi:Pyrazinamidase/nicotinamidase [Podospora fimiseda]|uniref:nicotinamidase n=1 Tax=Podospora fimiseda TaxID=252190 RepID=A0AAN7H0U8_9PEZI|nr:Pyrazinamidase/nicotinamidase [Podospora fimiseda]